MAAIGALKVPRSSIDRLTGERTTDDHRVTSSSWRLSFASSRLSGDKISPKLASPRRRFEVCSGDRKTPFVVVSPKAVSDSKNSQTCLDPDANRVSSFAFVFSPSVLGIILGGGAGTRLYPLTKKRAKPAVPLGANYRLIDIPVSNCLNSNISKIYVLTQFNSASLNRHLSRAYASNLGGYKNEGFVEVLAAQQSPENPNWFQGTADAVRQYLWLFEEQNVLEFLVLAGDHLYRMDYGKFIQAHRETDADITVAALPMDEKRATAFGLMKIDEEGRITEFAEKPNGEQLKAMKVDTTILGLDDERAKEMPYIASMGIYVVSKDVMMSLLRDNFPAANDFGSEVIPGATSIGMRVQAYLYDGYWEDIGTIEAFYNANLGITKKPVPDFSFYDRSAPIYTQPRYLPPSKMLDADVTDSVIGEGCVIKNCRIHHSVVGLRSCISEGAIIEDTLLMGADYYETDADRNFLAANGSVPIGIGKNAHIKRAIIDKNARIGENVKFENCDAIFDFCCSFYDRSAPIYTQPRYLPPSKMLDADVTDSVIGEGCVIKNCRIHHSVVGLRSCISEGAIIEDTLLMGADYYETDADRNFLAANGSVPIGIGKNAHIKRAIIDKNARIGENVKVGIINSDNIQEAARETDGYFIKSGIVTIMKDALIPSETVI
ncbi:hypothetical protein TEA_028005 [Camellia sinensis var. sinensis]|uniref:Glucose-1-phosphate adenylyltransferase n=1 Tax=Camellia sinensis var. sinensis TaxID=542762 RepID=A0A4S4DCF0_CAMSN|nr:hypothetical protein TEA_028005 [Camellia sinensis var. sinensis]